MNITTNEPISIRLENQGPDVLILVDEKEYALISGIQIKDISIYQVRHFIESNYQKSGYNNPNYQRPVLIPENDWFQAR